MNIGLLTPEYLLSRFDEIQESVEVAFDQCVQEQKINSREFLIKSNSAPLVYKKREKVILTHSSDDKNKIIKEESKKKKENIDKGCGENNEKHIVEVNNEKNKPDTMRKNMTKLYDEILSMNIDTVYIGEDIEHGGYYLVTEGLAKKYPMRYVRIIFIKIDRENVSIENILNCIYDFYIHENKKHVEGCNYFHTK